MSGGLTEGSIDKKLYTMRVPIELAKKICHKFGGFEVAKDNTAAYIAALESAVEGVELTEEDLAEIEERRQRNIEDRKAKRAAYEAKKAAAKAAAAGGSGVAK